MATDTLPPFRVRLRLACAPSLDPHFPQRRQSFVLRKAVLRLSLLRSFRPVLWTQRMPFMKEKKTSSIHHGQAAQRPPARVQNKNASADLSPCNGISTVLGQHEACPKRDDKERTRPYITPSIRTSQSTHRHFVPLSIALNDYDPSLTYISDDVVLFWQPPPVFSLWTISPFTVDVVAYTCAEQFMMASKARLFGNDSRVLGDTCHRQSPRAKMHRLPSTSH